MEKDDAIIGRVGVTVCLRDMGNGTSRIFFNAVKSDKLETLFILYVYA